MKKIKEAMMNSRGEISANSLVKEIKPTQEEIAKLYCKFFSGEITFEEFQSKFRISDFRV